MAVLLFNKSQKSNEEMLNNLGIVYGKFLASYVNEEDRELKRLEVLDKTAQKQQ